MASASVVKQTAKTALKNNWLNGIDTGTVLIFAFLSLYIAVSLLGGVLPNTLLNVIWAVVFSYVLGPLLFGVLRRFWHLMWNTEEPISEVFIYFSEKKLYLRAAKLITLLLLRTLVIGFILMIPAIISDVFSSSAVYEFFGFTAPTWVYNLSVVSVFLKSAAVVLTVIIMLKYYLSAFLIIADEDMPVASAISKSAILSRASLSEFLLLILSHSGWILLSLLVFPLIFTLPYFITSYLVHARFSVASYNKTVKEWNNTVV